ncbi:putative nucleoporin [Smittium culicis]|uniref:Putative nucleoporin n=1 Tax=Smittium culicis TaxID=133412 RepID=A0A1R1XYJ9_9FUNG|nr:putative nucleoporin [Smittium culicis]
MGLFPQIERAWITVDHRLIIWNYEDNNFYTYEEQDQTIINVGIIEPKKGIFSENVSHILVVATTLEIFLLGVEVTKNSFSKSGNISLYTTQLKVSADNIMVSAIVGTKNGRIFLSGNDGHIYELLYHDSEGWINKKCRIVNLTSSLISIFIPTLFSFKNDDHVLSFAVDNERGILYTLSRNSIIEVISLGKDGTKFDRIIQHKNIYSEALIMSPAFDSLGKNSFEIVSINVVPVAESNTVHLVAISNTGSRLYFSTYKRVTRIYSNEKSSPETLELIHVRKANTRQNESLSVHNGLYLNYATILANVKNDDYDEMVCSNIDNSAIQQSIYRNGKSSLVEYSSVLKIEGKTWAISQIGNSQNRSTNDLCNTDIFNHTKVALLTNSGINILAKQNPLDMVIWLVSKGPIIDIEANAIIEGYGRSEMCSMCLTVLSSDESTQRSLSLNAVKNCSTLFFEYGGVPYVKANVAMTSQLVGKTSEPQIIFSGRHDGLYLFLARLLTQTWDTPVFKLANLKDNQTYLTPNQSLDSLLEIQSRLIRLQTFINRNQRFIPDNSYGMALQSSDNFISDNFSLAMGKSNEGCWKLEADSLFGAYTLIQQIIESISFLKIVTIININVMANEVENSIKSELCKATLSELATSLHIRKVCRELVVSVVGSRNSRSEIVENIGEALGKNCGSFFSEKDVKLYRAFEYLRVAQKLGESNSDPEQQQSLLQECLEMFTDSGILLGEKKLKQVVSIFCNFNWHLGALNLCLGCAKNADPNDLAINYYNNTVLLDSGYHNQDLKNDDLSKQLYDWRIYCYNLALLFIKPENSEISNKLFLISLNFTDILFHTTLYDFLLSSKLDSTLTQIQTPFLVDYLRSTPVSIQKYDLLWRHYAYFSKFSQASAILHDLASGTLFKEITLAKRMEYLSLAISNAKSSLHYEKEKLPVSILNQMTDQLKTAQIQMEIVIVLSSKPDQENNIKLLNSRLFNVTELYDQFAQPLNLYEQILLLYKLSNFTDRVQIFEIYSYFIYESLQGEITNSSELSGPSNNIIAVCSKISSLGIRLHPSDSSFPLDLVVGLLVTLIADKQLYLSDNTENTSSISNPGFITQTLLDSNIPCVAINDIICSYLDFLLSFSNKDIIIGSDLRSDNMLISLNSPLNILKSCIIKSIEATTPEGEIFDIKSLNKFTNKNIVSILLIELQYLYRKWIDFSSSEMVNSEGSGADYDDNMFPAVTVTNSLSKYVLMANGFVNSQVISQLQQLQTEIHAFF